MNLPAMVVAKEVLPDGRVITIRRAKPTEAVAENSKWVPTAEDCAYERRVLNAELNRWGHWIEMHSDYEGYPGVNILAAYIGGSGGGSGGHRILCRDMPSAIYATHARVLTLSEPEQEAVWIWYVTRVKPDGTLWSVAERCGRLGITEEVLRKRLSRARQRIMGVIPR